VNFPGPCKSLFHSIFPSSFRSGLRASETGLGLLGVLFLVSCHGIGPAPFSSGPSSATVSGSLYGGEQPIAGAQIQMYAAGTGGDGSAATPLLTAPVTTNSSGQFGLTGLYQCPSAAAEVYLVATGGNPGLGNGETNTQIALMTALGPCGNLSAATWVKINEVTTVAAAYALAPFMQSYASIGSAAADAQMMADAFTMAGELASTATGVSPGPDIPAGQTVPAQKLNTLAGIVSMCINTAGGAAGDSSPCGLLFSLASASNGPAPTDTVGAVLQIAENPTNNVAPIFDLGPALGPFQPSLCSAPADWTLAMTSTTPTPVFSPAPGTYATLPAIALSDSDSSAAIYYTEDGSAPTSSSIPYTGALVLPGTTTIRAVAIKAGIGSMLVAGTYTLQAATVSLTPTTVTLAPSQAQAFTATVSGTTSPAVAWSLSPAIGTISSTGVYTAPAFVASGVTVTVTASSVAASTASASASVQLTAPPSSTAPSSTQQLSFSTQPANASPGASINPAVVVSITDGSGTLLTGTSDTVTLSLAANGNSATLGGTVSAAAVNGQATFSNVNVAVPGTGYQLQATATGATSATSNAFAVNPAGNTSAFSPPPANACQSSYDTFYSAEPGVIAYWPMCEPGTNANLYDYAGPYSFIQGTSNFGGGTANGGVAGPVPDGETATQVPSVTSKLEYQGFSLNKNAGTLGVWINTNATAYPVSAEYLGSVAGASNVMIQAYLSPTNTICYSAVWTSSAGANTTVSQCGYTVNTWHRVVMTWTAGTLSLYVDGALQASKSYTGALDNSVFYYQLFPGCCVTNVQMTLAKALVANQAWSVAQVAQDYAPLPISPPAGGVYVSAQQLGTVHRDVLGYADNNQDISSPALVSSLTAGLAAAGVTSVRYAGGFGGISADLANWRGGALQCNPASGAGTTAAQNLNTQNNLASYFASVAQPLGLDMGYMVNYGTNAPLCNAGGDPVVNGANLVQYANVTNHIGIKYWEIGNEQYAYGSAIDLHPNAYLANGGNGTTSYATYEPAFYSAMKAVDPTIQIAVPVVVAPNGYNAAQNYDYPVFAGALYDAVVFHSYPLQDPIMDGTTLYQDRVSSGTQVRGQLLTLQTMLLNAGKPADAIWVTEWDGEQAGNLWSKQTMGAAEPLFVAANLAEYMQAGVRYATWWAQGMTDVCSMLNYDSNGESAYNWWDGCGNAALTYTGQVIGVGEESIGMNPGDITPAARGFQVLSQSGFVTEGEHMLRTVSDEQNSPWLLSYAATHGTSYAVILINRDRDTTHTVPVSLAGQTSGATVTQWTYGRGQYDQSASQIWSAGPTKTAYGTWSGSFEATLPPWSVSVLVFQ